MLEKLNEVIIDNSNLKDFLEQDLESLEFILNDSDDAKLDLTPEPIYKDFFDYYRKTKKRDKYGRFVK